MRLSRHLPDFINDVYEYQQLDITLSAELDLIDAELVILLDNQFVNFANDDGLSKYEEMYSIPTHADIVIRRFNILSRINNTVPYTFRWLDQLLLSTVGIGNYFIDLQHGAYSLYIGVSDLDLTKLESLRREISNKIPANLTFTLEGTLLRTLFLDGTRLLDGNTLLVGQA